MAIRNILAEEGLVKKAGSGYFDEEDNELDPAEVQAIRSGDPEKLAQVLVKIHKKDFDLWLDAAGLVVKKILAEAGVKTTLRDFKNKVERAAHKALDALDLKEFKASPHKKELQALANGLRGYRDLVAPSEVKYLTIQPRRKGGKIVSLIAEDKDGAMGSFRVGIVADDAEQAGTTLEAVIEVVKKLGGTVKTKGMGPGRPKPAIGYDGWAW